MFLCFFSSPLTARGCSNFARVAFLYHAEAPVFFFGLFHFAESAVRRALGSPICRSHAPGALAFIFESLTRVQIEDVIRSLIFIKRRNLFSPSVIVYITGELGATLLVFFFSPFPCSALFFFYFCSRFLAQVFAESVVLLRYPITGLVSAIPLERFQRHGWRNCRDIARCISIFHQLLAFPLALASATRFNCFASGRSTAGARALVWRRSPRIPVFRVKYAM